MNKVIFFFIQLLVVATWAPALAEEMPKRGLADDGAGRVFLFGHSSEFSGGISGEAMEAYAARVKKDYPKAEVIRIHPFTAKRLKEVYAQVEAKEYRQIDAYFHTHGFSDDKKYTVQMENEEGKGVVVDGTVLGALKAPANFYLMTCHAGGAQVCSAFPKAKSLFVASPSHKTTRSAMIASMFGGMTRSEDPLPSSPYEFWERVEDRQMKNFVATVKDIPTIKLPNPTGCVVGDKIYGGVCRKSFDEYGALRREKAAKLSGLKEVHFPE